MPKRRILAVVCLWLLGIGLGFSSALVSAQDHASPPHEAVEHAADAAHEAAGHHGPLDVPLWSIIPFAVLLLIIAVLPLVSPHWWEHNTNKAKISIPLGLLVAGYLLFTFHGEGFTRIEHSMVEFTQFIILLGSLFVISGGVVMRGDLRATPLVNTVFLAIGGLIASFIGTTGASMLLIRPVLKTNSERKHVVHTVIFFIFIVSNIGGCLTPLGDPPLFLGFLQGVPFAWTFSLWKEWALALVALLAIYYIWDTIAYRKEEKKDITSDIEHLEPIRLAGAINFLFLGGVIVAVALSSKLDAWFQGTSMGASLGHYVFFQGGSPFREILMLIMVGLSLGMTPKQLRIDNNFNYVPIVEVAVLFVGIFLTMIPALQYLNLHGAELGVNVPWKFFWATGTLSSFLDNAPTYLVFLQTARGLFTDPNMLTFGDFVHGANVPQVILQAISLGAVFMGANTYIGNGPNFMVKAVAEGAGVKMPSFFGYMLYSVGILIPLFIVMTLLFFV